jgi:hypothetical protein
MLYRSEEMFTLAGVGESMSAPNIIKSGRYLFFNNFNEFGIY